MLRVDSIQLEESDSTYLGEIGVGFAVDSELGLFVPSRATSQVFRYNPRGRLVGIIGRKGAGPGEFANAPNVLLVSRGMLFATDSRHLRINAYAAADGAFLGSARYAGSAYLGSMALVGDRLWFGMTGSKMKHVVGSVLLAALLSSDSAPVLSPNRIEIPTLYRELPELGRAPDARLVMIGDTILVGFTPFNLLQRHPDTTSRVDSLRPPARLRRGGDIDSLRRHLRSAALRFDRAMGSVSILEGLWKLSDGTVVLAHLDLDVRMQGRKLLGMSGRPFITLLSSDLRRACVDAEVPVIGDGRPALTLSGTRLYVIEQVVPKDLGSEGATIVRSYDIDQHGCEWVSMPIANVIE